MAVQGLVGINMFDIYKMLFIVVIMWEMFLIKLINYDFGYIIKQ